MSPPKQKLADTIVEPGHDQDRTKKRRIYSDVHAAALDAQIWQGQKHLEEEHSRAKASGESTSSLITGGINHLIELSQAARAQEKIAREALIEDRRVSASRPWRQATERLVQSRRTGEEPHTLSHQHLAHQGHPHSKELSLDDLQKKLIKKVSSIEDFIKFKLRTAVGESTKSQRDVLTEKIADTVRLAAISVPVKVPVELVSAQDFSRKAQNLFDRLDVNQSGALSKADLGRALQDPRIKGQDAQLLAAIYGNYERLVLVDEGGFRSLTKQNLSDYEELQKHYDSQLDFANQLKAKGTERDSYFMRVIGATENKYLSKEMLNDAWNNAAMRAEDRRLVQFMLTNYSSIMNAHGDRYFYAKGGISIEDMIAYPDKVRSASEFATMRSINFLLQRTNDSQNRSNEALFSDKLDPLKCITPDAVKQGTIGDCYFEAAVASVAKTNPSSIRNMIKENVDGTYTVTFPGARDEPITISAPTEAERGLFNTGGPSGIWATVLEKANGQYMQQHFWRRNFLANTDGGQSPTEGSDGGGFGNGLSLLTGNPVDMHLLSLEDRDELRSCLNLSLNSIAPKAIITFTGPNVPGFRKTADNFTRGHVHSITAFNPFGPGGGTLTIRNPWGYEDATTNGTIKISFDQFAENFCGFFSER